LLLAPFFEEKGRLLVVASDLYKASSSLRGNTSTFFSRSSRREEDDEEALKWAAIEKLHTYNRLKKGLLASSHGVANEIIDIDKLGVQERQTFE